ncbi:hypothetical protein ABBQ38_014561 [Trebouxia sp. C0009 RCD-2024]
MGLSCTSLYERVSGFFHCHNWLWPVSQDALEEPILQPPVQTLSECWVLPRAFTSAHLHEPKGQTWHVGQLKSPGSSDGSWDIDTACADGHSTPRFQVMASRQHSGMTTSSHDIEDASEGIELRHAKANVLLGQYHMERSGQFVASKPGHHTRPGRQHTKKDRVFSLEDRGAA